VTVIEATPRRYRGINYRSALEAKWAAFFHHMRWDATYHPTGEVDPTFLVHEDGTAFYVVVGEEPVPDGRPDLLGREVICVDQTLYFEGCDDAWAKATNDISGLR